MSEKHLKKVKVEEEGERAYQRRMHIWNLVKVYECPDCGEWVQDMCDAGNHVCKQKREGMKE